MKVLIVSKTRMHNGVCVGGILYDGKAVRLLDKYGHNQSADCPFQIGDIWDLTYVPRSNTINPHSEDVLVSKGKRIGRENQLLNVLTQTIGVSVWNGDAGQLFDNLIQWTGNGSGYISKRTGVPNKSVGFFRSNMDLNLADDNRHYEIPNDNPFAPKHKLSYVGLLPPIPTIPQGTLIRVSLARWWEPENAPESRCYAQISGWY